MKYVLDASVAVKWFMPEVDSDKAVNLRIGYLNRFHELIAPDVFPVEIAHAFTRSERRNLLNPGEAATRLAAVLGSSPLLESSLALLPRAVAIASIVRIGVYDCLYLALAEREGCELVTADERLVNSVAGRFSIVTLQRLT